MQKQWKHKVLFNKIKADFGFYFLWLCIIILKVKRLWLFYETSKTNIWIHRTRYSFGIIRWIYGCLFLFSKRTSLRKCPNWKYAPLWCQFSKRTIPACLHYLCPVLAFGLGIFLAEFVHFQKIQKVHWRQVTLLIEIIILFGVDIFHSNKTFSQIL